MVAALERGREGDLVAGLGAAQRGVLAVQHGAGADLVGDVGGGVNLLAVDRGDQVDGREVAGLGLAVDGLQGREAAAQVVEFLLHVLVGDLGGLDLDDDGFVDLGQLERGNDRDLGGEDELSTLGAGHVRDLGDVNLGLSHGAQVVLVDGVGVVAGQDLVDDLLDDGRAAETLVDDARRNVALTEAGDVDLSGDLLVRLVHLGLQFLVGNLNGQANLGGLEVFNGALHVRTLRSLRIGERPFRAHNNSPSLRHALPDVSLRRPKRAYGAPHGLIACAMTHVSPVPRLNDEAWAPRSEGRTQGVR